MSVQEDFDGDLWIVSEGGLFKFNRNVPITPVGLLKQHINCLESIVPKHKQNFITIDFVVLDYKNIFYMYKMEGFNKDLIN